MTTYISKILATSAQLRAIEQQLDGIAARSVRRLPLTRLRDELAERRTGLLEAAAAAGVEQDQIAFALDFHGLTPGATGPSDAEVLLASIRVMSEYTDGFQAEPFGADDPLLYAGMLDRQAAAETDPAERQAIEAAATGFREVAALATPIAPAAPARNDEIDLTPAEQLALLHLHDAGGGPLLARELAAQPGVELTEAERAHLVELRTVLAEGEGLELDDRGWAWCTRGTVDLETRLRAAYAVHLATTDEPVVLLDDLAEIMGGPRPTDLRKLVAALDDAGAVQLHPLGDPPHRYAVAVALEAPRVTPFQVDQRGAAPKTAEHPETASGRLFPVERRAGATEGRQAGAGPQRRSSGRHRSRGAPATPPGPNREPPQIER